jgi:hypothetical protein
VLTSLKMWWVGDSPVGDTLEVIKYPILTGHGGIQL